MRKYTDKNALIAEIEKTAGLFIGEFDEITESDKDKRLEGVDRTPGEIIAYQLGWMKLMLSWDRDELQGGKPVLPAPGYKWNRLGPLYRSFYDMYRDESLSQLREAFIAAVGELTEWIRGFSDDELFLPGGRKWAASTPSCWSVGKWIHINTVAPFKSFRGKIRKWKKQKDIDQTV